MGDKFTEFVEDIRANGVREPIWRHPNGHILDGRNRYRACQELGVECPERTFEGSETKSTLSLLR